MKCKDFFFLTMKMIFISNNNYIQKFLFNNLGNMGKQEVIMTLQSEETTFLDTSHTTIEKN